MRARPLFFAALGLMTGLWTVLCLDARQDSGKAFAQASAPDLKSTELVVEGEQVFAKDCSIPYCHGKDGAAGRAPAVRDKKWEVAVLRKIVLEGIPKTSMPNWDDKLSERQVWAVVAYILSIAGEVRSETAAESSPRVNERSAESGGPPTAASLPESLVGNPARGEQLFFESSNGRGCGVCHAIDGKGNAVGPELTGSSRKGPQEIFRDIVFPGASIDSRQQLLRLGMNDGEKILGLKQEETSTSIRVFDMGSAPPVLRRLEKERIKTVEPLNQSAMPARYGEIYTLRELLDLVSFLKSSGAPSPVKVTFLDLQ